MATPVRRLSAVGGTLYTVAVTNVRTPPLITMPVTRPSFQVYVILPIGVKEPPLIFKYVFALITSFWLIVAYFYYKRK